MLLRSQNNEGLSTNFDWHDINPAKQQNYVKKFHVIKKICM